MGNGQICAHFFFGIPLHTQPADMGLPPTEPSKDMVCRTGDADYDTCLEVIRTSEEAKRHYIKVGGSFPNYGKESKFVCVPQSELWGTDLEESRTAPFVCAQLECRSLVHSNGTPLTPSELHEHHEATKVAADAKRSALEEKRAAADSQTPDQPSEKPGEKPAEKPGESGEAPKPTAHVQLSAGRGSSFAEGGDAKDAGAAGDAKGAAAGDAKGAAGAGDAKGAAGDKAPAADKPSSPETKKAATEENEVPKTASDKVAGTMVVFKDLFQHDCGGEGHDNDVITLQDGDRLSGDELPKSESDPKWEGLDALKGAVPLDLTLLLRRRSRRAIEFL